VLNQLTDMFRHHIELNNILIGLCWEKGGADWFIRNHGFPEAEYVGEGDISGLDVSIYKFMLEIYKGMSACYMDFVKMDKRDVSLWKRLHHYLISTLACKIVPVADNDWCWFIGKMPSGDWDTSHGDSWIMLLLFCMFMADVCREFPQYAEEIKENWMRGYIMFPTYGDDHNIIVRYHRIALMINETRFGQFLKKHFNIMVRDVREYWGKGAWMCVPDTRYSGEVLRKGVKFLQRQFYFNQEIGQYVCTRDASSVIHKLFMSSNRADLIDVASSAVGIAMDTMGNNDVAYDLCNDVYSYVRFRVHTATDSEFEHKVFLRMLTDKYFSNKIQQRLGRSPDDMVPGFPLKESLKARNGGKYVFKNQFMGNFYDYDFGSKMASQQQC